MTSHGESGEVAATKHSGVTSIMAGCYNCQGDTTAKWFARNAMATAARHAKATGHETWCDQVVSVVWNKGTSGV